MKLYKEYIKEREDLELIETDHGFITYKVNDDHVFIDTLYVTPKYRSTGEARKLAEEVYKLTKKNRAMCCVCTDANNWKKSKKFIEHMGYKELFREYTLIYLVKEK